MDAFFSEDLLSVFFLPPSDLESLLDTRDVVPRTSLQMGLTTLVLLRVGRDGLQSFPDIFSSCLALILGVDGVFGSAI